MFAKQMIACLLIIAALAAPTPVAAAAPDFDTQLDTYSVDDGVLRFREYAAAFPDVFPGGTITLVSEEVLSEEDGVLAFTVNVSAAGFYRPVIEYFPIEGKNSAIQRALFVDGVLPYKEMALVGFSRIWQNAAYGYDWRKDNQGNDLRPAMLERPEVVTSAFWDLDGYIPEPLSIYLDAGEHTITLFSVREPMLIKKFTLEGEQTPAVLDYGGTLAARNADDDTHGVSVTIQAEDAVKTSSQMLYPTQNQGSPSLSPSSPKLLLNNTIGGNGWRETGQWIEWAFDVPETGYYLMDMHVNQSFKRGVYVTRKITIDGEIPFSEMSGYGFTYAQNWKQTTIGEDAVDGGYKFFLSAGRHILRMEAVLGGFSHIISEARTSIQEINTIYRKVIRLTGVAPDKYRDYQIEASLPDLSGEMVVARDRLTFIIDELRRIAGKRSDRERVLVTMRDQLATLINDNEKFGKQISSFKVNARACGTWLNSALEQPLELDSITFHSPDTPVINHNTGFWSRVGYELQRLFYSFVINYNAIGNVDSSATNAVTLWVGSGRDQANVIKRLTDDTFTGSTGVSVNVMLVDMSTLLQATLAGQGPDVAVQVSWDLPMNYGLRDAVLNLSRFDDLPDVTTRFADSAMTPYSYNNATYALPETQVFPMMFYRKDILTEMGLSLPQTWDDVNVLLASLARSQMEVGMLPGEGIFAMLLYQNGGRYYNTDATQSALNEDEAVAAFKQYCEFYTDYKLDRLTSVEERFRTGECPIIIADYTLYNNLQISAPDLRGLWGMAPVPGIAKNGVIDRSTGSYGTAAIVMEQAKNPDACWEFLKWWTSAETQIAFGREMESLMGASARIPTANLEAFEHMAWPTGDLVALREQFAHTKGIPQVPGGYFTFRNVNNAFYSVTTPESAKKSGDTTSGTPREQLTDKVILINDEIRYKRTEFGLPTR